MKGIFARLEDMFNKCSKFPLKSVFRKIHIDDFTVHNITTFGEIFYKLIIAQKI